VCGVRAPWGGALVFNSLQRPAWGRRDRVIQIGALLDIVRRAPIEGGTWTGQHTHHYWIENNENAPPMPEDAILLGDFNLQPTSPEYDLLAGPQDGAGGRLKYKECFIDAWVAAGHDENDGATFPASSGGHTHDIRLDYAFITESLAHRVRATEVDMAADGSDHQPLWVELDW
jgi:endonuclease/exonuclease/phosphatase family metal-dependent hydrolase